MSNDARVKAMLEQIAQQEASIWAEENERPTALMLFKLARLRRLYADLDSTVGPPADLSSARRRDVDLILRTVAWVGGLTSSSALDEGERLTDARAQLAIHHVELPPDFAQGCLTEGTACRLSPAESPLLYRVTWGDEG